MFQGIRAEQAAHREKLAGPTWAAISNWRPSAASRLRPRLGRRPSVRRPEFPRSSSSAPTSKSSRCTRIIALASGHRREDRDLVTLPDGVIEPDIVLVDRHPDDRKITQRLGISIAARP